MTINQIRALLKRYLASREANKKKPLDLYKKGAAFAFNAN